MGDNEPRYQQAIDGYGGPVTPWAVAREQITEGVPRTFWLGTTRADGRPHMAPIGAVWFEGAVYFSTGADTRKGKNLALDGRCVLSTSGDDVDVVIEGHAKKVTDQALLERLAGIYGDNGWRPTVRDGAFYAEFSAPSAGPPPWDVYEVTPTTGFGFGTRGNFSGATRWRF